jgi:predicted RNA-binding Zn ribbon-like protein
MAWPPRFIFVGGTIAIDFAQTGGEDGRSRYERWHTPEDLADWAEADPELGFRPTVSPAEHKAAWKLREAMWRTLLHQLGGEGPEPADHELIEAAARKPDLVPQWRDGKMSWAPDANFTQVMSTVARDAIDLFGTARVERFRKCANPTCGLMFVDQSRPGKRQWCTMERCGNLSKVAKHRARHRHGKGEDHAH